MVTGGLVPYVTAVEDGWSVAVYLLSHGHSLCCVITYVVANMPGFGEGALSLFPKPPFKNPPHLAQTLHVKQLTPHITFLQDITIFGNFLLDLLDT